MKIYKSRTYHIYSTYFQNELADLDKFSRILMKHNFCSIIYSSKQYVYRKEGNQLIIEKFDYQKIPNISYAKIKYPDKLSEYQKIYLYESANYKVNEEHILTSPYLDSFEYIRCFLNKVIAEDDNFRYSIYPMLKIYKTGIIHLIFRIFSSESHNISNISDFISNDINLFSKKFNTIKIPVELAFKTFIDKNVLSGNDIDDLFRKYVKNYNEGDNNFYSLDLKDIYPETYFNLQFIKDYIFDSLEAISISNTKLLNVIGSFWNGRPIVFIENSKMTEKEKQKFISSVLLRVPFSNVQISKFLESNLRAFDDYEYYCNEGVSLVINKFNNDDEFDTAIYPITIVEEEILNIYLLYKQELERISIANNIEQIFQDRDFIMSLKEIFLSNTNFGETRSIINYILFEKLKLNDIENLLKEKIELRSIQSEYFFNKSNNSFINALTIIFGILGSSSIFEYIIKPFFELKKDCKTKYILFYISTLVLITSIIFFIKFIVKRKYRKKNL